MKKQFLLLVLTVFLFSCKSAEGSKAAGVPPPPPDPRDFPEKVTYNVRQINIVNPERTNIRSNVTVRYRPESDVIANINEIENKKIYEVFDKPILNKDIVFLSEYSPNPHFDDIDSLLSLFDVVLPEADIDKLNKSRLYYEINRISKDNLDIYVFRTDGGLHKLYILEYDKNSSIYDYNIKIGTPKDDIINRFGEPVYFSTYNDYIAYKSFSSLREIHIFLKDNAVSRVQLISFAGE
jgi:hypothetical protein